MKKLLILLLLCGAAWAQQPSSFPYSYPVPNDSGTGTTLFSTAKLNSSGNAVIMASNDASGYIGVCVANCGKIGSAWIAFAGLVPVTVDGTATAQHYLVISSSACGGGSPVAGDAHDTGSTTLASTFCPFVGKVQTGATVGNQAMVLLSPPEYAFPGGVTTQTGNYTASASDNSKLTLMNCSSACTYTFFGSPNNGFYGAVESIGSTLATISLNGKNFNGSASVPTLATNSVLFFFSDGSNYFGGLIGGVVGPGSSTNNDLASFNGTTGALLQDSGIAQGNVVTAASAAAAANQSCVSSGASKTCTYIDHPDLKHYPAAICNNATAGAGWSIPASNAPTVACRAGTNNLGGVLQWANNNTTTNAQFEAEIPLDWDSTSQPFYAIFYGSGANTSGTVKWTFSTACSKRDGSVSDDPAFVAESTTAGNTMAVANRNWAETAQFANVTSGNNCVAGGTILVKITSGNGTATSTVNVEKVTITYPRRPVVQAN